MKRCMSVLFLMLLLLPFAHSMTFEELVSSYNFTYPQWYVAPDFDALAPEKEILYQPLPDLYIVKKTINYSDSTLSFSIGNRGTTAYNYAVHVITPSALLQRNVLYTSANGSTPVMFSLSEAPEFIILSLDTYGSIEESNESDNLLEFTLAELPFVEPEEPEPEITVNISLNLSLNITLNDTVALNDTGLNDSLIPALNSSEGDIPLNASSNISLNETRNDSGIPSLNSSSDIFSQPVAEHEHGFYIAFMPKDEQEKLHRLTPVAVQETDPLPQQETDTSLPPSPSMYQEPEREEEAPSLPELTGLVVADLKPKEKDTSLMVFSAVLILFLSALSLTLVAKFLE